MPSILNKKAAAQGPCREGLSSVKCKSRDHAVGTGLSAALQYATVATHLPMTEDCAEPTESSAAVVAGRGVLAPAPAAPKPVVRMLVSLLPLATVAAALAARPLLASLPAKTAASSSASASMRAGSWPEFASIMEIARYTWTGHRTHHEHAVA